MVNKSSIFKCGHFVIGAKAIGLDTVIMEGFNLVVLKEELNLKGQTSVLIVGVGHGAKDDYNVALPKSRLSQDKIIDMI